MTKSLNETCRTAPLAHRAEVLAALIEAILQWGEDSEMNKASDIPFAGAKGDNFSTINDEDGKVSAEKSFGDDSLLPGPSIV